jgi:site-specific DNA-methyltransferase (adenine-specific)
MIGLTQDWSEQVVFINPPYSKIAQWVEKAFNEARNKNAVCVLLIPARTDTKYWHQFIMKANKITFIKGRLKFGSMKTAAPFPSCVVEFYKDSISFPSHFNTMDNK